MLWRTAISTNTLFLTDISLNEQYSRPGTIYLFLRVGKFSASIFSDIHHPLEAPKSLETATSPAQLLCYDMFKSPNYSLAEQNTMDNIIQTIDHL